METNKHPHFLFNSDFNDYAEWNGTAWSGSISGAYFYGLEKAKNNGYNPIFKDPREIAICWFNQKSSLEKTRICDTNTELIGRVRRYETLTGSEIENIWRNEFIRK